MKVKLPGTARGTAPQNKQTRCCISEMVSLDDFNDFDRAWRALDMSKGMYKALLGTVTFGLIYVIANTEH